MKIQRIRRALLGDQPRMLFLFVSPTLLAIVMDVFIRGRAIAAYNPLDLVNYLGSSLASAGFWGGPLWLVSRLFLVDGGRSRIVARLGLGLFFGLWVLPFAISCYGAQALYHRVFQGYMARDTVRLGIALRGTLKDWLLAWGGPSVFVVMFLAGLAVTFGIFVLVRRAAPSVAKTLPLVPLLAFGAATFCFWIDFVESRSLQAAPPDTCFIHGVIHAVRDGVTGKGWVRKGVSLRTPAPLPPIALPSHRPNVVVIVTESVRADAMCSDPPPACQAPFLDGVVPDRISLGKLTTQSPGTFSACMLLWTGLPPTADFATAHSAPVLWEVAHAVGYRTAYVTSQNLRYDDFGAFVQRAGIDLKVSAMELGDTKDAQIGAPDERATARLLAFAREVPAETPYFAVLHFSNTHAPYRIDPALQPYAPHSTDPIGESGYFHNHYLNSVRMQERTLAAFLRELRALPSWDDTVVIFLSDHGEQFRERGGLYHIHSLYDEEVAVPGWLAAGPHALDAEQRTALHTFAGRRTYSQDVQATVIDLLGAFAARTTFPFAPLVTGRSLVRPAALEEPTVILSTSSGVWEADEPKYGVMRGDRLLVGSATNRWTCFDMANDPRQGTPLTGTHCGTMVDAANLAFPSVGR
jgi:hypothetical protein